MSQPVVTALCVLCFCCHGLGNFRVSATNTNKDELAIFKLSATNADVGTAPATHPDNSTAVVNFKISVPDNSIANASTNKISVTRPDNSATGVSADKLSAARPDNSAANVKTEMALAALAQLSVTATDVPGSDTLLFLLDTVLASFMTEESNNQGNKGGIMTKINGCPEGTELVNGDCIETEDIFSMFSTPRHERLVTYK